MLKKCPEFDEILANFKKVSKGGEGNQPMINSKAPVYNFDRIAKRYAKKYKLDTPSTSDGLYIDDITNKFYLIEFKSGTIEPENVFCKVYDSAVILRDTIFTKSYDEIRKNVEYILVYNHSKVCSSRFKSKNRDKLANKVRKLSKSEKALFKIKHAKNMVYANVYTLDLEDFISKFGSTFNINLG